VVDHRAAILADPGVTVAPAAVAPSRTPRDDSAAYRQPGSPHLNLPVNILMNLAGMRASVERAAEILGITAATLEMWFRANPEIKQKWDAKHNESRVRGVMPSRLGDPDPLGSEIDLGQFRALAMLQCTISEAASVLKVKPRQLQRALENDLDLKEAWEQGIQEGRASIRRQQFKWAERDARMSIWLGKQYLGQKDQAEVTHNGMVEVTVRQQLTQRILLALSKTSDTASDTASNDAQLPVIEHEPQSSGT
jgi:hypothetical protein